MTDDPQDRAETLRREAAWCLEQAKTATTEKRRGELIALAASFHELANSAAAHTFGAVMQSIDADVTGQPATQQQQQIQPKEEPKKQDE